jgi:NADP-dependent 3-hydroxy acid dehydrogenase YdfG
MNRDFRTAVVTGASRGTGKVIAKTLAQKGLQLVLAARSMERLNQVRDEIMEIGGRAISVPIDITDCAARRTFIDAARWHAICRFCSGCS